MYQEHRPRYGYTKIWPTSPWCPLCSRNSIARGKTGRPLYIPADPKMAGERCVIYVCQSCYKICRPAYWIDSVEAAKEHYKCHLELKTHFRTLDETTSK